MLHEGLTTGQAAKYISRHPKTLQAMDRAAYFPPGELRVGGATGCNRTWTATWEERRGSDRDARCAIAACHPQNRHLSRAIHDVGWSELRRQLEYKSLLNGSVLTVRDPLYASSKTCSE